MPGIIQDPRQNASKGKNPKAKRHGIVLINGEFIAYNKDDDKANLQYLPAGWVIKKDGIIIDDLKKTFEWVLPNGKKVTIKKVISKKSISNFFAYDQGVVKNNQKEYMKGGTFDKSNGFSGSDKNYVDD